MFRVYGLLVGLGVWAGWEVSLWLSGRKHVGEKLVNGLVGWVLVGGLIGARVYHVIDYWDRYYSLQLIKVLFLWEGGLAIWGVVVGGMVGLFGFWLFYVRLVSDPKLKILDLSDIVFIGAPLGQAIGRWGNFFNNELKGKDGQPLFLYESALNLVLFLVLWQIARRVKREGVVTGMYLIGYGLIRYFLEPLREEVMIWRVGGLAVAQLFSLAAVLVGVLVIKTPRWIVKPDTGGQTSVSG